MTKIKVPLLTLAVVAALIASWCVGAYPISAGHALELLFHCVWPFSWPAHAAWDLRELTVIEVIRPPRIMVATFAGIALGLSGAALQGMLRNPLVGPDLVGVSSGAAFGGVLAVELGLTAVGSMTLAFGGGFGALLCTFGLARLVNAPRSGLALILAGFFVGAFFLAAASLILYLDPRGHGPGIVYWLLGTFRGADPHKMWMIVIPTLVGGAALMALRWRLNLLSLGELDARSLGVDVTRLRWFLLALVSLMVSAQVAVSGVVGWVGLIVPHFARMLVGPDHRRLIPTAALLGGLFTLGMDDLTRSIVRGELPVSVLTACVGTPLICILFWKTQSRGWTE